ncbi:PRC-barrel domain-containing protein [Candidatus Pacearchaeota archaeon]|nr:PRC-barrel domain-containing protein [Candidatus Pacearchaeota archaeon]
MEYQYVIKKEAHLDRTVNIKKLIGKRVISKGGTVIGYVSEIRVNSNNLQLEGVVVDRNFENPIYIGKSYFSKLSQNSVILNVELSILVNGKKVVTLDGKVLGRVKKVNRRGNTNEIESLVVSSFWRKYLIPSSEIKQIMASVQIKHKHDATKIYLWKRLKQNSNL